MINKDIIPFPLFKGKEKQFFLGMNGLGNSFSPGPTQMNWGPVSVIYILQTLIE